MAQGAPAARETYDPEAEYVPPRNQMERALASMWAKRLNVTPIGVHDDFFQLGGNSIMATELLTDISETFGTDIPARTLFLQPTVAELAEALERAGHDESKGSLS